jgi:hypothetical protein
MMDSKRPILVVSDLQIPFEHKKALNFCRSLAKDYRIPKENVIIIGDEIDNFHGSAYPKDPDADLSIVNEFEITRERIKEWGQYFPIAKVCISNHGVRWLKRAIDAQIPTQLLKSYKEIFKIPAGWEYREEWRFNRFRFPFRAIHGMGYSGARGHVLAAQDGAISTVIGHLHSHAAVNWVQTNGGPRLWAANSGCLIDVQAFAFKYEKYNRVKPQLGALVIIDQGKTPIFHPLY